MKRTASLLICAFCLTLLQTVRVQADTSGEEDQLNLYLAQHKEMGAVDWQRGGEWIVFARQGDRRIQNHIFKIKPDGTSLTQLTFSGDDAGPLWSPNGLSIAFSSSRGGGDFFRMAADGTGAVSLGTHPECFYLSAWSPDSSKLAFVTRRDGGPYIALMMADTGDELRFVTKAVEADWHPFGDFLVVEAASPDKMPGSDGHFDHIYEVNIETRQRRQLTSGPFSDSDPRYSPDGQWIAFVSAGRQGGTDTGSCLCLIRRDGTGLTTVPLNDAEDWEYSRPDFSPDGQQLVFAGGRFLPTDLYVCRRDGTGLRKITPYYPR